MNFKTFMSYAESREVVWYKISTTSDVQYTFQFFDSSLSFFYQVIRFFSIGFPFLLSCLKLIWLHLTAVLAE